MIIKYEIETFSRPKNVRKEIGYTSGSQVGLYAFQVADAIEAILPRPWAQVREMNPEL